MKLESPPDVLTLTQSSTAEVARHEDCFFFVEVEVLDQSHDWKRDELALYLLHCRGYHPVSGGSTYGEKGSLEVVGLTRKPWMEWTESLDGARGLIRTIERGRHPVTLLASVARPFPKSFAPTTLDYRPHDAHRWKALVEKGAQLIKIPWRAMDIDRMNPEARIGALTTTQSLRLLVWAYSKASGDGWVPSNLMWLESEHGVIGRCSDDVRERLGLSPDDVRDAVMELVDCELLESGELDKKGRGILFLAHPLDMAEVEQGPVEGVAAA